MKIDKNDVFFYALTGSSLLSDPYNIQSCTWLLNFWRGPTLYFLGLITWALEMFDSMKLQMEKYGLLIIIIDHLKRLPLNAIHGLVEVSYTNRLLKVRHLGTIIKPSHF